MKRIARAVAIGAMTIGLAAGVGMPAQATTGETPPRGLCAADWGIPMPCQMF